MQNIPSAPKFADDAVCCVTVPPRRLLIRCLAALIAVLLSFLIRWALVRHYGELPPFSTFYLAVLLVAIVGDIWAGLLATALSAFLATYWFFSPIGHFALNRPSDAIALAIFCGTGICVSVVAELYNRKRKGLAITNAQLRAEINERERVEDALRLSQEKFAKAFANNQAAIGITQLTDGAFLEVNDTWSEMVGYSEEEMIGRSSRRMIWPTRDATARCVRKLREKGSLRGWEQEFVKKSGEVFVTELSAQIWKLNKKKLVVTTLVDITARKRAEEEVRASEERLRAFLANSAVIAWLKDEDGRYAFLSSNFESRFQVRYEDWKGKTDADLWPRRLAEQFHSNDQAVLASDQTVEVVEEAVNPDGDLSWWLVSKFSFRDTSGKRYVGGVGVDITERKRAEEGLYASEERLRLLGDNLPNSMVYQYTHDPEGTPRFLYVSAGVERLNGVRAEDVLKDSGVLYSQLPPDELPALLEAEEISARELSVFEHEVRMQLPDGQFRWMHLLSCPRLVAGRVIWDGVQTDITERKHAQQALLRSEKLASVGRMAAAVSHEINNPLDAVMNLLFLANGTKDLPESARHLLETADAELRRIAHITRQSLGFYRELTSPSSTSVTAVLDSAVDLLKSKIKAKHAVIDKQWDKDVQITALAGEMRQVFCNLISNSLHAIDERGSIKLRVSKRNQSVRITVSDNGRGIPATILRHIFEPFFTTKDKVGTGLGLWVSQQIVEKHGGTIRVRSCSDGLRRGTTFSIVLPEKLTPAVQRPSPSVGLSDPTSGADRS
jgi:PAS domain S-box-containing protein